MSTDELFHLAADRRGRFDAAAAAYDRYRPRYPAAMFDYLAAEAGAKAGAKVVEVGAGPGIATEGLVERGCRVVCIEPGENLAAIAAAKFAGHDGVQVVVSRFEDWDGADGSADLVLAATSWHWVHPTEGWDQVVRTLRPQGSIALAWTILVGFDPPWLGRRLRQLADSVDRSALGSSEIDFTVWGARLEATGLFGPVSVERFPFERELDADSFVATQATYGSMLALDPERSRALEEATRQLIESECGGRVVKREEALVFTARRGP